MTDKKITELTAITTPASGDIIPIVDIDANATKKITAANLATYVNASYPAETIRDTIGDMLTGNTETDITVTHDDANDKINFVVGVTAGNLPTSIDAAKIANGNVSNDEFQALDGVTSGIQAQLDAKVDLAGDTMTGTLAMGNNAITTSSTVDGRDLSVDGTKLDAIEASATADQTASEIRTLVESGTDSNVFTDADHTKLNAIEASATADQTGAEIKSAYEGEADTNAFTDADHTKLDGIEASADVTDATNVTAAGALMDSECTNLAAVKGINQALTTSSSPSFTGVTAALTGNSSTATALATARDISLGGEVTGTGSFDGSSNVTITSTIAANTIGVNELACSDGSADQFLKTNGSGTISFASVTGATTINNSVANRLVSVASVTSDFDAEANLTFDGSTLALTGNMTVSGNVDGRDVSADGTKLDGIETSATADQTNAEIRTAVEAATDSNVFTDADHTKLNAIEASATADQTDAEIRAAVEAATDSNVFTDADHTKLNAIEASADVTDATNVDAAGALMKSGGAMTGAITTNSTFDGVDVAACNTTANAALPRAGGTMTGNTIHNDDVKSIYGTSSDGLEIFHDGSNSYVKETGTGGLRLAGSNDVIIKNAGLDETLASFTVDGACKLYYDDTEKLATASGGVTVAGTLTATTLSGAISGNISQLTNDSSYVTSSGVTSVATGNGLSGGTITSTGTLTMSGSYTGSFSATGNITAYSSDQRLKDFKGKIDSPLDKIEKLNGYYYEWNDVAKGIDPEAFKDGVEVGVNAQEVEAVLPEVVAEAPIVDIHKLDTDYKTVYYDKLVPLLIEGIKELKAEVDELKKDK